MPYPPNVYVSPPYALKAFRSLVALHGQNYVKKTSALKPEKELAIAAIFLLGLYKIDGSTYYLRPGEDISNNIDVRAITLEQGSELDIQVTEFEDHNTDIVDVIKKKISRQEAAQKETRVLLINIREHDGYKFYPEKIARHAASLQPSFKSIWILMAGHNSSSQYHAVRIWPLPKIIDIKYNLETQLNEWQYPDYLHLDSARRIN